MPPRPSRSRSLCTGQQTNFDVARLYQDRPVTPMANAPAVVPRGLGAQCPPSATSARSPFLPPSPDLGTAVTNIRGLAYYS